MFCCTGGGFALLGDGADHLREAAAIGADRGDHVVVEFQLHAAEGVAAAFVVGGEDRAADQLAEQPGRDFEVARLAEAADGGNSAGFSAGSWNWLRSPRIVAPLPSDSMWMV